MYSIGNLMAMIGAQKTLIIACDACGLSKFRVISDKVFIHVVSGSELQQHDPEEKERIQYFVENKRCSQVIFLGSIEQHIIDRILNGNAQSELSACIKFNTSVLLRNKASNILSLPLRDQMLTELTVISQCRILMDYYFIRSRVENKLLLIRGVIAETPTEQFKVLFQNGIVYNDMISMN